MPLRRDDIVIRFGGDDSRFQKAAKRVGRTADGLVSRLKGIGSTLAGVFGVGLGVGGAGIAAGVVKLTQNLDALGKTAKGLNATVDGLSALQYAVERTSVLTGDQFNTVLQKLVKHIGQANRGVKTSQALFAEMGLSWEYLASLKTEGAFVEVADAISKMDNEFKRSSLTQKIFEDRWRDITPTLLEGREGLAGLIEEAREMGVPTQEAADAAARLNDQIKILSTQMEGLAYTYGPPVIDFISYWVQSLTGASGLTGALDKVHDKMARLEQDLEALEGNGDWLDTFWTAFLTDAEKAPVIEAIRKELAALREEADALYLDQQKRESEAAAKGDTLAGPNAPGKKTGKRGASRVEKSTGDQLVENRLARQRKDITQDEYRQRRSEIILGSDPAGDLAKVKPANYGSVESSLTLKPTISPEFTKEIEKAVNAALNGKTYTVKVQPEIVGYTGGDAIEDAATEEGERQ